MANKILGMLVLAFVGVIIGIAFLGVIANNISDQKDGVEVTNASYTTAATANGTTEITGKVNLGTLQVLFSNSTDTYDWSSNFSITRTDNDLFLVTSDDAYAAEQNDTPVLVSYTYGSDNYIEQGSSRALLPLILIFGAIAILAIVITLPVNRLNKLGMKMRMKQ